MSDTKKASRTMSTTDKPVTDDEQVVQYKNPTRRQRNLANLSIKFPNKTQEELAIMAGYSPNGADVTAAKTLQKPHVIAYIEKHSNMAERTVVDVMRNARKQKKDSQFQRLAGEMANSILDRVHGKATQRTEVSGSFLNVSIDLKGEQ